MNELVPVMDMDPFDIIKSKVLALPQASIDVLHIFEPGKYIREMRAKAGTVVVGASHVFDTFNVFVQGSGFFRLPDGTWKPMQAPATFISGPGAKCVQVTSDLIWQNWWPTECKDVQALEKHLFVEEPELEELTFKQYLLDYTMRDEEREDFAQACQDIGMSLEEVQRAVDNTTDQVDWPYGTYKVRLGTSTIDGCGVIATADIAEGEEIGLSRVGIMRTPLGRYINHSNNPNAVGIEKGDDIMVVALRPIRGNGAVGGQGEEVTVDYRQSVALSRQIGR